MNEFRVRCGFAGLALLSAVLAGCGGDTPRVADKAMPAKTAKNTAPTAAAPAALASAPAKTAPAAETKPVRKVTLNPFQMPEIPEEFLLSKEEPRPDEYAAPNRQTERPKVRLLGFSDVDGFKALVELKGDVLAVEAGDVIEGVEVVSIEPPKVTFQFASSNWSTKLFDQPWSNQQTGLASTSGSSRASTTQSRSTPRANAPAYGPRTPATPATRGPAGTSILGAAIPGIGGSSEMPSIPGTSPAGDASSDIPSPVSVPGMPSGGVPGMPGGAGAMPGGPGAMPGGVGAMPGGPGGLPGGIN